MKIILDTNVILSAFITQGLSSRVLDICIDNHMLYISDWIIDEVIGKLENKFKILNDEIKRVKIFLKKAFIQTHPQGEIPKICRDDDDNNILYLAEYTNADIIITGDKDLLILQNHKETDIMNPRTFMKKYHLT